MEYLQELNPQQKKAVLEEHRLICVIAGPGCGKPKTLITRIIHLLTFNKIKNIIKKIIYDLNYNAEQKEISTILSLINRWKNSFGVDPLSLSETDRPKYQIYQEYQKYLQENQALDFNDLLIYIIKLFQLH